MKSLKSIFFITALFLTFGIIPYANAQNGLNGRLVGTVTSSDGNTIYLYEQLNLGIYSIAAYVKDNDKYVPIDVFMVKKKLQSVIRSVKYESWIGTNPEGGFFALNKTDNTLYIPLIDDSYTGSDQYLIYQYNGRHFKYKKKGCGYWLHPSLGDYEYLYALGKTKDFIVRIDQMHDESLRYASWRANLTMKDKPNIILYSEGYSTDGGLKFYNGDFVYEFNFENQELIVYREDKIIKRQKMELLYW